MTCFENNKYEYHFENFGEICRLCLSCNNIKPIFSTSYNEVSLQNIIGECLSLKVEVNDCLPQQICVSCEDELIRCYTFREKCIQIENILIDINNKKDGKKLQNYDIDFVNVGENSQLDNITDLNNDDCDTLNNIIKTDIEFGDKAEFTENDEVNYTSENIKTEVDIFDHNILVSKNDDSILENQIAPDNENVSDSQTDCNAEDKNYGTKKHTHKKKTEPQGPPFKCLDCRDVYDTLEQLKEHRRTKHYETRNHTCSICNKNFTRSKLKQHMRVHTKEKPFGCKVCSQAFSLSSNLKRHMMTHTGERPYSCDECGKGFIQAHSLQIHKKTHTTDLYFSLPDTKSQHITCEICGRGFKRLSSYRIHLTKHYTNDEEMPTEITPVQKNPNDSRATHVCDICSRAYRTKDLLKSHQRTHGERTYLCSECGKRFITKSGLQGHLKVHTGEKPHTCTVCNKSFSHLGSFEAHRTIHTGRKPYNCHVCNKGFTQVSHLKYHSATHTGERPHSCTYCHKKFALKGNLTVHLRIHTGETPYLCPECGKGFYDSSSMKKHQATHFRLDTSPTEVVIVKSEYDSEQD